MFPVSRRAKLHSSRNERYLCRIVWSVWLSTVRQTIPATYNLIKQTVGILDPYDYYAGEFGTQPSQRTLSIVRSPGLWSNMLVDTDKGLGWFFEQCAEAGPATCALYEESAEGVKERYTRILTALKTRSLAVTTTDPLATAADYGVVTYRLALSAVFDFLYSPYKNNSAAILATALAAAEHGDGKPLWDLMKSGVTQFRCQCPNSPEPSQSPAGLTAAIACGDGAALNESPEDLQDWYDKVGRDSQFAPLWQMHATCTYVTISLIRDITY